MPDQYTTSPGTNRGKPTPPNVPVVPAPPNQAGMEGAPQMVYLARPSIPEEQDISEVAMLKHQDSKRLYPELNLSKGEFVISAVRRHPIGLISIWFVTGLISLILLVMVGVLVQYRDAFASALGVGKGALSVSALLMPVLGLVALVVLGGFISSYVYSQNKFFLTNESVMQFIQISLFARKEQTISLANIEDASYRQIGVVQHVFGYGSIRLSTQGDETTYRFSYVANPRKQIALLNDAIEAFKNGRPFTSSSDFDED